MTANACRSLAAWAVVLAAILPGAGCSKSDAVGSSVGSMTLQVQTSGDTGRFSTGQWTFANIGFQPYDLAERDVLGGQYLTVTQNAVTFDLNGRNPVLVATATMSRNTFAVTKLTVNALTIGDGTASPNPQSCVDLVTTVPVQDSALDVVTFDPPLVFQVPQGATKITLVVDVPNLINAYLTSYQCVGGTLQGKYDPVIFARNLSSGVIRVVQSN